MSNGDVTTFPRTCSKCGETKPLPDFVKDPKRSLGYSRRCKACARAYYYANRERIIANTRAWNVAHEEERREYRAAWAKANAERLVQYQDTYRAANREAINERARKRRRENPEKNAAKSRRYIARRVGASGTHTWSEVWQMLEDQGHVCAYCEVPLFGNYQVDHMVPLSRGGSNEWSNLAVVCPACNRRKHAANVEDFFQHSSTAVPS